MPRAKRFYIPGLIWHMTHRCHERKYLLTHPHDRRRWLYWLQESKKRYGIQILGYAVTSNHIHLLVQDNEESNSSIAKTFHLTAGRTAQEYNFRTQRRGAFWEDRYHATAVESGTHFMRCLSYIDLNMVRARVVRHPREWQHCGYHDVLSEKGATGILSIRSLMEVLGIFNVDDLVKFYDFQIESALKSELNEKRDDVWTKSVAVGSYKFVEQVFSRLQARLRSRKIFEGSGFFMIR